MADLSKPTTPSMGKIINQFGSARDALDAAVRGAATAGATTEAVGGLVAAWGVRDTAAQVAGLKDRIDEIAARVAANGELVDEAIAEAQFINTGKRPTTGPPIKS